MGAWSFDVRAMKKSCVHSVQADGRLLRFEAFSLFYRDARAETLATLLREQEQLFDIEAQS
jgi:hypothetical protein